ncbi:MAG TPA: lysophospholipid acyltransferase family protein [Gammaproteobacteria bacterium]|nr:lysophospholipid acyltransferase family protein [Gammaproteobacteria bacterium]
MNGRTVLRLARLGLHLLWGMLQALLVLPLVRRLPLRVAVPVRQHLVQRWLRQLLAVLGVRLEVAGAAVRGPLLLVANHVSWLDVAVIGAVRPGCFVAKSEVGGWPLIGWLARRAGTLFVARGVGEANRVVADTMTFQLRRGESVVLFPEGTTGTGETVGRFHARFYQAALRAGVPVQPAALRYADGPSVAFVGEEAFVANLLRLLRMPRIHARLNLCAPLALAGLDRRALAETSREAVCTALAREGDRQLSSVGGFPSPDNRIPTGSSASANRASAGPSESRDCEAGA